MSMNFSEFKKLIGADPWNRDTETLRARHSAEEFEQAASDAEAFERKLQSALLIEPSSDFLSGIKNITQQPVQKRNWVPLALAASLIIAIGAAGIVWKQNRHWDNVEDYLVYHYSLDGTSALEKASDSVSGQEIRKIMTSLNATAGQQLTGRIKFIRFCPTPQGRGAHMVVSTDQGPMTIIYMPGTQVTDGEMVEFDQVHAYMVSLEHGSVAIIGRRSQPFESLQAMIRSSLTTRAVNI
jgi:hypothetical protein